MILKYNVDEDLVTKQFIYMCKSRILMELKLLENFCFLVAFFWCADQMFTISISQCREATDPSKAEKAHTQTSAFFVF